MSRIVGQSAAVQAAAERYHRQPLSSTRIISPPIPPPIVLPVAVGIVVEGQPHWHVPGDHHDPVAVAAERAVVGLFLVVVFISAWRAIVQLVSRLLNVPH
jgi:hypothetical protein